MRDCQSYSRSDFIYGKFYFNTYENIINLIELYIGVIIYCILSVGFQTEWNEYFRKNNLVKGFRRIENAKQLGPLTMSMC